MAVCREETKINAALAQWESSRFVNGRSPVQSRASGTIVTAHQPVYLPWLGLFAKIARSDMFCVFDTVQYEAKSFQNRNLIKTHCGTLMLTVPVTATHHFSTSIQDIRISPSGWQRKHCRSIELSYSKAEYFEQYYPAVKAILNESWEYLRDLNTALLLHFLAVLGLGHVPVVHASQLAIAGSKSGLVLDMCQKTGAAHYIFGSQGRNYADIEAFGRAGILVEFQDYKHPVYRQLHGGFAPNMAIIDLLFNEGPASLEILRASA